MPSQFATSRVTGTAEAIELIEALKESHGPLAFAGSAGPSEEGELICRERAELLPDPDDIRIGEIGGAPVYVDGQRDEIRGRPRLVVDVAPGPAAGIGFAGLEKRHFVTRTTPHQ